MHLSLDLTDTSDIKTTAEKITSLDRKIFSDPWTTPAWESDLTGNFNKTYILHDNGTEVGLLNFALLNDSADLKKIGIIPEFRNRGYASRIMQNFLKIIAGYYVTEIFLEVAETNHSAIHLYQKFQFKQYLRRKKYYAGQIDAICMRHELRNI